MGIVTRMNHTLKNLDSTSPARSTFKIPPYPICPGQYKGLRRSREGIGQTHL